MRKIPHTSLGLSTTSGNQTRVGIIIVIAVLANIAGYAFNLYARFSWFDKVLHPYTIFALTLLIGLWVYGKVLTGYPNHRFHLVLLILCIGVAIGALWEIAEWTLNQLVVADIIQGKFATITDLIVDTLGAGVAGVVMLSMLEWCTTTRLTHN